VLLAAMEKERAMRFFKWMCLVLIILPADPAIAREKLSPKEILDHVDDLYRGESSYGKMDMKVQTEHWTREMKMEGWSQGKDKSLFRILAPKKEKGMATLKSGENIWNYLPKVKRVIKLPSSMMGGSWMGSHLTNDDLVKESRMAEDFEFENTFRGERDGKEIIEITCTPKPKAAVVWGKVVVIVREGDYMPVKVLYYDEDLELARTMIFEDVRKLGGRTLPALMKIVPADKPNEYTEFRYEKVEFNIKLDQEIFSLRNLQR
jgi:outer membrane lipoprotein-sorting protein